jgi:uncharacterized RDD family membrane protein YckC
VEYATFWQRLAAYALDAVVGGLIMGLPFGLLLDTVAIEERPGKDHINVVAWQILFGMFMLVLFTYIGLFEGGRYKGTPGKLILGLRVEDADTGGRIGFWRAILRRLVLAPAMWVFGIGVLSIFWHPRRQGWHDRAVRAVVTRHQG